MVLLKLLFLFVSLSQVSGQFNAAIKTCILIFDGGSDLDPNYRL